MKEKVNGPDLRCADGSCEHSDKLAIAHALTITTEKASIQVAKNLPLCYDCHG